eukprot:TRINITY_DN7430_c0_g1_i1.p1 TRINITY_DN7430_c0_g1~~TRINITY_DN7430_c0_g1_i1.p1  ORF type:complete len:249 (-),score=46.23 TRINITY_DN7430_c0_g1_i1:40-720(-)
MNVALFVFLVCLPCLVFSQTCSNTTNCDAKCRGLEYNSDSVIPLLTQADIGFIEFQEKANKAIKIIRQYPGVVGNEDLDLRMTLQYFCCYAPHQYDQVAEAIRSVVWEPFDLKFSTAECYSGGNRNASDSSIVVVLDNKTQKQVASVVEAFETAIVARGVPVKTPRSDQQPFHVILGIVDSTYPVEEVLTSINNEIDTWNRFPIKVTNFFIGIPPNYFFANGTKPF